MINFNREFLKNLQDIQDLKNNWDGEGAIPFDASFLNYIFNLISNIATEFFKQTSKVMPIPAILPVVDGSIDVHWKKESFYDILINFDPESGDEITFACNIHNVNRSSSACTSDKLLNVIIPWIKTALIPV